MNKNNRSTIKICFMICLAIFALSVNGFAYILVNGSGGGYGGGGGEAATGSSIESYVVEGAGYFLKSHSGFLLLLNRIELADVNGLDYDELGSILNTSITNMEGAYTAYTNLVSLAEVTPYNPEVTGKLQAFDYETFLEKNGLNPFIFKDVEQYLKKGDITGTYKHIFAKLGDALEMMRLIKAETAKDTIPGLWKLNRELSRLLLFGQYIAEVFHEINK